MANKLYVTDEMLDVISVLDLATSNYTVLIRTGFNTRPRAIVLDPYARYIAISYVLHRFELAIQELIAIGLIFFLEGGNFVYVCGIL